MKRFRVNGKRLPFYRPVEAVKALKDDGESDKGPTSPGRWSRIGALAGTTIILGTIVQLVTFGFLIFLWTGMGPDPHGINANPLWLKIIFSRLTSRAVTVCAYIIRSAVGLQATVCTGLAAALVLEAQEVRMANAATFSIMRAANSGPTSFIFPLVRTPRKLVTSMPAFLIVVLWLVSLVISFSSTILLSDFDDDTKVYHGSVIEGTPILQSMPDLIDPFRSVSITNPGVWHQPLQNYNTFGEAILEMPSELDSLSDTGLIKRSILPFGDQRRGVYSYEGASFTYTSRVGCTRPALSGFLSGIKFDSVETLVMEEARLSGTLTWESQDGYSFLDGLSCEAMGAACPPIPFDCALPYADSSKRTLGKPTPSEVTTSLCIIQNENSTAKGPQLAFLLAWETNVGAEHWGSITNNRSQLALPQQLNLSERAVLSFGGGLTLNATVCLFNSTLELERVALHSTIDGLNDSPLMYDYRNLMGGGWITHMIVDKVTPFYYDGTALSRAPVNISHGFRHIMSLNSSATITPDELDEMNHNSPYYDYLHPESGVDIVARFVHKMKDGVTSIFSGGDTSPESGNFSIYMCANCRELGGRSLRPHPYQTVIFHGIVEQTGSVAQAIHAMLFWLHQAWYYNAQPAFEILDRMSRIIWSDDGFSTPSQRTGLIVVGVFMLLNLICVFALTGLFLLRTRRSLYGNMWHVVAQLVAGPEVRLALENTTMATDKEVEGKLQKYGIKDTNVGLWDQGDGRMAVASGTEAAVAAGEIKSLAVPSCTETRLVANITETVIDEPTEA